MFPFLPFLYYSNTSPSFPLHLGLVLTDYILLTISVLLNCSFLSSLSSLRFILCLSVRIIMFLFHPTLHVVILPWNSTELRHLTPPLFCFILLFIATCCAGFYSSFPSYILLSTTSLTCPFLSPHYSFRCIKALHMVFLPCNSHGLRIPPSFVLF